MKQGLPTTPQAIAMKVKEHKEGMRDFTVPSQMMKAVPYYDDMSRGPIQLNIADPASGLNETFPVGDYAHGQFADWLKIPKRYYDKMKTEAPELLSTNINHWLDESPQDRMVTPCTPFNF